MSTPKSFTLSSSWCVALILLFFVTCTGLGFWQLQRAHVKEAILADFKRRIQAKPFDENTLPAQGDLRFYPVEIKGHYDYDHPLLLDNKTHEGRLGYELYVPFKPENATELILVDQGFIPRGSSRQTLPTLPTTSKALTTVKGLLNLPPAYFALGSMLEQSAVHWPLRIQYVDLIELSRVTQRTFFPFVILAGDSVTSFQAEQMVTITPDRHRGYALQWFALALTLLVLSALSMRGIKNKE
ncbi:MAG: SURF1 family protein [Gammaproteobacteria bacterium]|nr:SURF1 family protein [Gammaproteobacteria bacterium]